MLSSVKKDIRQKSLLASVCRKALDVVNGHQLSSATDGAFTEWLGVPRVEQSAKRSLSGVYLRRVYCYVLSRMAIGKPYLYRVPRVYTRQTSGHSAKSASLVVEYASPCWHNVIWVISTTVGLLGSNVYYCVWLWPEKR